MEHSAQAKIIETPYATLEVKGEPTLMSALSRLLIVNATAFLAGAIAGKAFDKVYQMRTTHTDINEV